MKKDGIQGSLARFWHPLEDGRLQCDLCPRFCRLHDGQRGLCFVRGRSGNDIVLTTWGRSSGFCVDPIEKKPLNHFLPGTPVLSFGTAGCNLTCKFCQNWHISKAQEWDQLTESAKPEAIAAAAVDSSCPTIAFTYNDPVIFHEYAVDTAIACRERGIRTAAVTAGYVCPEPREEFYRHIDAANVDLKGFKESFYKRLCSGRLGPVLDTLIYLRHETKVWLEITTLLIPGENDDKREIETECQWIHEELGADVPLHFTAFHPDWKMRDKPHTSAQSLSNARGIALRNGLKHVYTGNVHDPEGQSTYCSECGAILIGRDQYRLTAWSLSEDSFCEVCGARCPGVFDNAPGTFGNNRLPIEISHHV